MCRGTKSPNHVLCVDGDHHLLMLQFEAPLAGLLFFKLFCGSSTSSQPVNPEVPLRCIADLNDSKQLLCPVILRYQLRRFHSLPRGRHSGRCSAGPEKKGDVNSVSECL